MNTTRVRIDPDDPSTLPEGRIDPVRVDATTEVEIAAQEREDDGEVMQDGGADSDNRFWAGCLPRSCWP